MNLTWPGDPGGNDTERITYALDEDVIRHCSHALDLHCWQSRQAATTIVNEHDKAAIRMGEVTATRFIRYGNKPLPKDGKMLLRQSIQKRGGNAITIELAGQYRIHEKQVMIGLRSMTNIAKLLGMIPGEPELEKGKRAVLRTESSHEVSIPCSGIFIPALRKDGITTLTPDDYVEQGQCLGHVIRDDDLETVSISSPISGYLHRYGFCHWNTCGASLPSRHSFAETGDIVAMIVGVG
jgi:predicted deacylase